MALSALCNVSDTVGLFIVASSSLHVSSTINVRMQAGFVQQWLTDKIGVAKKKKTFASSSAFALPLAARFTVLLVYNNWVCSLYVVGYLFRHAKSTKYLTTMYVCSGVKLLFVYCWSPNRIFLSFPPSSQLEHVQVIITQWQICCCILTYRLLPWWCVYVRYIEYN